MKTNPKTFYISRKSKLLKSFDKIANKYGVKCLRESYGDDFAQIVVKETHQEYERIIPELPYIGRLWENYFAFIVPITGWLFAFYRVMESRDKTAEEVMKVCYKAIENYFNSLPSFLRWLVGKLWFSKFMYKRATKLAERSQKREYPGDWVFTTVKGDGNNFDWQMRFTKCCLVDFFRAQGVEGVEFTKFCGVFDVLMFKAFGVGFSFPESTIGAGCKICVEQFKKGGEVVVPEEIKKLSL
jgi:hypothetical protein